LKADDTLRSSPRVKNDWEDVEPGFAFARAEARRLFYRSSERWPLLLLLGVFFATLFVLKRELLRPPFTAELVLRIVESDKDLTKDLRPPRAYKDFIWGVCLSGPQLTKIIEAHKLYPTYYRRDPQLAVEAMRDDLDLEIWGNYFDPDYFDPNEARTARVSISWHHRDPELALTVVRELAAVIDKEQSDERNEAFRAGGVGIAEVADRAEDRVSAMRQTIVRDEIAFLHASGERRAQLSVTLHDLREQVKKLQLQTDEVRKEASRVQIEAAWEKTSSGIRFELLEPGVVLPREGGGPISTTFTAIIIVLGTFLLGGLLAGAFEVRVRDGADIARLGLPLLGTVQSFRGDRVGSLAARLRTEDRLRLGEQ
jgi:hypothetical protein